MPCISTFCLNILQKWNKHKEFIWTVSGKSWTMVKMLQHIFLPCSLFFVHCFQLFSLVVNSTMSFDFQCPLYILWVLCKSSVWWWALVTCFRSELFLNTRARSSSGLLLAAADPKYLMDNFLAATWPDSLEEATFVLTPTPPRGLCEPNEGYW